jgi:hypothetical protein
MMSSTQIWIAALGTLALYTYLYKENPAFRLFEHLLIGLTAAHTVVMNYDNYIKVRFRDNIFKGEYVWIIPVLIGLLIYTRYFRGINWLARIPMSLTVGYGVGYTLGYTPLQLINQLADNFIKFSGASFGITLNNIIFFVCTMSALAYFFFTISREKYGLNTIAAFGRYTIVVALGVSYGSTVQGRISLLLGRLDFLLKDWLTNTLHILNM